MSMKKKLIACLMTLVVLVTGAVPFASAAADPGIELYGYNYALASVYLNISSSGKAVAQIESYGKPNYIDRTSIVVYLEKKSGSSWTRVNIGTTGNQWSYSTASANLTTQFTHQLTSKGTYRAVCKFTYTGSYPGHTNESVTRTATDTY